MESQSLGAVLGVLSIFGGTPLAITVFVLILRKLQLSNSAYPFAFSIGVGVIFSVGILGFVMLSTKFNDWSFLEKLIYAGKFFPLFTLIIFISMEVINQKFKQITGSNE